MKSLSQEWEGMKMNTGDVDNISDPSPVLEAPPAYAPPVKDADQDHGDDDEDEVGKIDMKPSPRAPSPAPSYHSLDIRLKDDKSTTKGEGTIQRGAQVAEPVGPADSLRSKIWTLFKPTRSGGSTNPDIDPDGVTALHRAALAGQTAQVEKILKSPQVDIHAKTNRGSTALHLAVQDRNSADLRGTLTCLLDHGAAPALPGPQGLSALHLAAVQGQHIALGILLQRYKGNIDIMTPDNWTPLHLAAGKGHVDCVTVLLARGANHGLPTASSPGPATTALHTAVGNEQPDVVSLLLSWPGVDWKLRDASRRRAVDIAVSKDMGPIVRLFLKQDPGLEPEDKHGGTWLHRAVRKKHISMLEALLEYDTRQINEEDRDGWTALHLAAAHGPEDSVKLLLVAGADTTLTTPEDVTALQLAAGWGMSKELAHLVRHGQGLERRTYRGRAAIHFAAEGGHIDCLSILLTKRVDILSADNNGYTPFMLAAQNGKVEVMKKLLREERKLALQLPTPSKLEPHVERVVIPLVIGQAVDVNLVLDGSTALHHAARSGHSEIVKILLANGADDSVRDPEGQTPLNLAVSKGRSQCVKYLMHED